MDSPAVPAGAKYVADLGGRSLTASTSTTAREVQLLQQMICLLVANGEAVSAVSKKLMISEGTVEQILATEKAQDMVVRFQHDIAPDPHSRLRKMSAMALNVQTKLLVSPGTPDAIKAKVANEVLDRSMGKAIQITENRNLNFDLKDALQVDRALQASQEKLRRIEEMQKRLSIPIGRADDPLGR